MTTNRIAAVSISLMTIAALAAIVLVAIGADRLWSLIGGIAAIGGFIVLLALIAALILRWSSNPIGAIADARLALDKERNRHDEEMIKNGFDLNDARYRYIGLQIAAPAAPPAEQVDPRHALLINLCLLTIKSATYGPASKRLMSADDAQADRSGQFADRENWSAASRYGQDIGLLYTQVGGPPREQGLKIKGDGTAADLLVSLHERNLALDAAIAALPATSR